MNANQELDKRRTVVVMHGDQTGEELLQQALRVMDPELLRVDLDFQHFDLSLQSRREPQSGRL